MERVGGKAASSSGRGRTRPESAGRTTLRLRSGQAAAQKGCCERPQSIAKAATLCAAQEERRRVRGRGKPAPTRTSRGGKAAFRRSVRNANGASSRPSDALRTSRIPKRRKAALRNAARRGTRQLLGGRGAGGKAASRRPSAALTASRTQKGEMRRDSVSRAGAASSAPTNARRRDKPHSKEAEI